MDIKKLNEELQKFCKNHMSEDMETVDYEKAVKIAFPQLKADIINIIIDWYENEGAADDFDNNQDFAEFIKDDIYDMLDAADPEQGEKVAKALNIE